jgi:hypothetical protein
MFSDRLLGWARTPMAGLDPFQMALITFFVLTKQGVKDIILRHY